MNQTLTLSRASQPQGEAKRVHSSSKRNFAEIAHWYAEQVVAGEIVACKQVIQACQRHLNDLARSAAGEFPFVFNAASANRACEFIEALPHTKGKWAARRELIRLEPWQIFKNASIFGWVERDEPTRYRFREAYIEVPRKNGKSADAAGIALYKFAADDEAGAEVYIGATSEDQAKRTCFKAARSMAKKSPGLCKAFGITVNVKNLVRDDDSILKPLIRDPGDGDSPSCVIVEEYHEHPTDAFVTAMITGMAARENPLALYITTSGFNRSYPCYAKRRECEQILAGVIVNERVFVLIFTVDPEDDIWSDEALIKANPNYGISVDAQWLRDQRNAALTSARKQNAFKTKHLNIWVNAEVSWLNMQQWDQLADPELHLEDFDGDDCIASFDLASRVDLASAVKVFQRWKLNAEGKKQAHYYLFARSYLNAEKVEESKNETFQEWERDGYLMVTPGNVTDYNQIGDDLVADAQRFNILQVPHDPFHGAALMQFVQANPDWTQFSEFVQVQQSRANLSPVMREFEALVLGCCIHHTGDPVLAWAFSNVVCERDRRGELFPTKASEENKIDPAVATLMAMRQWLFGDAGDMPGIDDLDPVRTAEREKQKQHEQQQQSRAEKPDIQ